MMKIFIGFLLFHGIIFSQTPAPLPHSVDVWTAAGTPEIYAGEDLYKLINGGADIFHEYGFNKVLVQKYIDLDRVISAEVYEMKDSSSAYGIFSLITFNTGKPVKFKCEAFAGDEFFLFYKGNCYVSLSANEFSADVQKGLHAIAESIEEKISPAGKPGLVDKISKLGYSRAAYIKGNLGLYNLRSIDFGRDFKVEEGVCIKEGNSVSIILMYKSKEESERNIKSLIDNLDKRTGNIFQEQTDSSYIIKDRENRFLLITGFNKSLIIAISSDKHKSGESAEKLKNTLK